MQTKDIIKKYRQSKLPVDPQKEANLVYERLYKSVDIKLAEAETKIAKILENTVRSVQIAVQQMTEHVKSLKPLQGEPGERGDNYNLTLNDMTEIASQIKVPVVEKVIEKREIVREIPQITEITKQIENKDTPEQIIDKVNSIKEGLFISSIKSLQDELDKLKKSIRESSRSSTRSGGGMGNTQHESKLLASTTSSVATTYSISGGGFALWVYYQGQAVARGVGYTVANDHKTINLLFTPVDGTYLDIIYIR